MLRLIPKQAGDTDDLHTAIWIDLISPTDDEVRRVAEECRIDVPTLAKLKEIEATSRLRADGDTLYMSAPLILTTAKLHWDVAPAGFILAPNVCVTVRYAALDAFDVVADELDQRSDFSPAEAFVRLLEEIVDRAADHLENASAKVGEASQAIFFDEPTRRLSKDARTLRDIMRTVGQASDRTSRVRYTFLSVGRMASFVIDRCIPKLEQATRERFDAIRHDIGSLDEFETSLSDRIQLLHSAATGFISIEQNDVVKVLTTASVVGVPPVLVVGIYGMNFKNIPELNWHYGFLYALALCVASAIVPYLWFKWRDWI